MYRTVPVMKPACREHWKRTGPTTSSIVAITNTTFTGNSVSSADAARGGGLRFSGNPGTHTLAHNTFSGNDAAGGTATVGEALAVTGGASGTLERLERELVAVVLGLVWSVHRDAEIFALLRGDTG